MQAWIDEVLRQRVAAERARNHLADQLACGARRRADIAAIVA
jgi:ABC-type lipopolysaccharide export system ATPase subunit